MDTKPPKLSTARESLNRLEARIAALTDPTHKRWLTTYRDHWWGEVMGDVDAIMATMSQGPIHYSLDGHPFMGLNTLGNITSNAAARRMYQGIADYDIKMAGPTDDERFFFDEHGLAVIALITGIFPGSFFINYSERLDPDGLYLARWGNATTIRFDADGLMMGEEILNGAPVVMEPADRSLIPRLIDGPLP